MLRRLSKRSGNRYTLISIVLILLMLYLFKITLGGTEGDYPQYIYYGEHKYQYNDTVRGSSLSFVRKYGKNYNGYALLVKRGESNAAMPEAVYVFAGWRTYKEYLPVSP